jgi:hypothetical protein
MVHFTVLLSVFSHAVIYYESLLKTRSRRQDRPQSPGDEPNGVRSLDVCCWLCHHWAILSADPWPDHVPVPAFGPRMVCTRCGIIGADARPNWREQPARLSGAGTAPWR